MSLQRQNFLLSYLKTLSVGPAGACDLPRGNLLLNQPSQQLVGSISDAIKWLLFLYSVL